MFQNLKVTVAVAAILFLGLGLHACGLFRSAAHTPEMDVFECQLDVLVDAVPAPVAEDVVMALRIRNYEYAVRQLLALGLDVDRIRDLAKAYDACLPPAQPEPVQPEQV